MKLALSFPIRAPVVSTLILWGATCWEERAQIPEISALLPYRVFVCVWCESLQTADLNNTGAAGRQETWKGWKWSQANEQHAGRDPTLTTVGHLSSPPASADVTISSMWAFCTSAYLAVCSLTWFSALRIHPPPRQGRGRRQSRGGYVIIYLSPCIKNLALSFERAISTNYQSLELEVWRINVCDSFTGNPGVAKGSLYGCEGCKKMTKKI